MAIERGAGEAGASGSQTNTFLGAVNYVLERLREDTVTTYTSTSYSKLISHFVNQAKREVEDAWDWHRLRTTIQVTTTPGTYKYSLVGAGERFRLLKDPFTGRFDVLNQTRKYPLQIAPSQQYITDMLRLATTTQGAVYYFDFNGSDANGDPIVNFWAIPNSIDVINFQLVVPQPDITNDNTVITVPYHPVVLRAYALALNERGEDMGTISNKEDDIAGNALDDAIARDAGYTEQETVWRQG